MQIFIKILNYLLEGFTKCYYFSLREVKETIEKKLIFVLEEENEDSKYDGAIDDYDFDSCFWKSMLKNAKRRPGLVSTEDKCLLCKFLPHQERVQYRIHALIEK